MRILVTGSAGFIGRHAVERLSRHGHEVVATGRGATGPDWHRGAYVAADLTDEAGCKRAVTGVEAVVHCAGKAGAWGDHQSYERANVVATRALLEACRSRGVKSFVNISSPSIYFAYKHQHDLKESDVPRRFSNAYAATKYAAEQLVAAAHGGDLRTVSLRPRGVLGAGDRNWLPRIIRLREAGALVQPGDGQNHADFTSVENLLDAMELCLSAPAEALGRTYSITNGMPERLWSVIERALAAVGLDGARRRVPLGLAMGLAKASEWTHRITRTVDEPRILPITVGVAAYSMTLSIDEARRRLGYRPRVSTDDAIQDFSAWWRAGAH